MKRTSRVKPDVYQIVTDRLISLLESGVAPWQRNYNRYGLAANYGSGHVYSGINAFLLNFLSTHQVPFYLTYKQARDLGGQVRKGATGEIVLFYKTLYKDEHGNKLHPKRANALLAAGQPIERIPMPRKFHVFNVADIDGIAFKFPELTDTPNTPVPACESFLGQCPGLPPIVHTDPDNAYYSVRHDKINLPPITRFHCAEAYYKTLFHEIIHATGSAGRLHRPGIALLPEDRKAGSAPYALEELIAELGAAYLSQLVGINTESLEKNSAAYLEGYLSHLKEDKRFLFQAATAAQKAIDFLTNTGEPAPPD